MAIDRRKYVNIISGVGGGNSVSERELIGRIITTSEKAPVGVILEFEGTGDMGAAKVGTWFGLSSPEYKKAAKYFNYTNKYNNKAKKISFARYTPEAVEPSLRAILKPKLLDLKAITDGNITISMGGLEKELTALNFSAAVDFATIASTLQSKIREVTEGGELWTNATVTFSDGVFTLKSGLTGSNIITYAKNTDENSIADKIGWSLATRAVVSNGADAETPLEAITRTTKISDNFGSFGFMDYLSIDEITAISSWTSLQNVSYMYCVNALASNYVELQEAVKSYSGVAINYDPLNEDAYIIPMMMLASINFGRSNGVINFMYHKVNESDFPITVDDEAPNEGLSDKLDALNINYNGATQTAGKKVAFYQRGNLQGDIVDMGVYCNEMWLKDAMAVQILNLLLAVQQVSASIEGEDQVLILLQSVISRAKYNGTIKAGKELTDTQKAYIDNLVGQEEAWREVYLNGNILQVDIFLENNKDYVVDYLLVYSKGDSVRKVQGTHTLI